MFLCRKSLLLHSWFFLRPVLCFRGARRSAMMLSCVFATSRTICAFFVSVELLLGTFWWFFCVFLCLGPICWPPGGLLCSFFASWIRKGTYLCQLAPPDHQLGGKWGHKVDLCSSRGSLFGLLYVTFSYCSDLCDFVKIEFRCRRELDFDVPGRSKCHFFSFEATSKNYIDFGRL